MRSGVPQRGGTTAIDGWPNGDARLAAYNAFLDLDASPSPAFCHLVIPKRKNSGPREKICGQPGVHHPKPSVRARSNRCPTMLRSVRPEETHGHRTTGGNPRVGILLSEPDVVLRE